jgi:hypothetical protein
MARNRTIAAMKTAPWGGLAVGALLLLASAVMVDMLAPPRWIDRFEDHAGLGAWVQALVLMGILGVLLLQIIRRDREARRTERAMLSAVRLLVSGTAKGLRDHGVGQSGMAADPAWATALRQGRGIDLGLAGLAAIPLALMPDSDIMVALLTARASLGTAQSMLETLTSHDKGLEGFLAMTLQHLDALEALLSAAAGLPQRP